MVWGIAQHFSPRIRGKCINAYTYSLRVFHVTAPPLWIVPLYTHTHTVFNMTVTSAPVGHTCGQWSPVLLLIQPVTFKLTSVHNNTQHELLLQLQSPRIRKITCSIKDSYLPHKRNQRQTSNTADTSTYPSKGSTRSLEVSENVSNQILTVAESCTRDRSSPHFSCSSSTLLYTHTTTFTHTQPHAHTGRLYWSISPLSAAREGGRERERGGGERPFPLQAPVTYAFLRWIWNHLIFGV